MFILILLLTAGLLLTSVVLILLILIQLPKKEAGAGLAFGAGATDALFGAGSGTVLTKITKYAAGAFFLLAVILSLLHKSRYNRSAEEFQSGLAKPLPTLPAPTPSLPVRTNIPGTNVLGTNAAGTNVAIPAEATNVPASSTNLPK